MGNNNYKANVIRAEQLYERKLYLEAAQAYSFAFSMNKNLGLVQDRYEASRCWALAGEVDFAFHQLQKVANANFGEYDELLADTAFIKLQKDSRWNETLTLVKYNHQTQDPHFADQFKRLNKTLEEEINSILIMDQEPRPKMNSVTQMYGMESEQMNQQISLMAKNDSINQIKLEGILNQYGWPPKTEIGIKGGDTLFLVLQHAPLEMQTKYLPLVESAVQRNDVEPSCLAYLEDRIAMRQGKKQKYGSQLKFDNETKKYILYPLMDPENVNKRRAAIGLSSLEDYLSKWDINWNSGGST